jgi:hypothetical protein
MLVTPGRVGSGACDAAGKLKESIAITADARYVLNEIVIDCRGGERI